MGNFRKHPNVAMAAKSGEPSMDDEEINSAPEFIKHVETAINGPAPVSNNKVGVETVSPGKGAAPGPNQPIPGSHTTTQQPDTTSTTPAIPPAQVNDVGQVGQSTDQQNANDKQDSTSKKKGKKGLRKLIPF